MASLIPGYEYDIFISYRQKDNKGDRWVSEFVEALKTELESTFKEEISVYFDINPHDGLLETHDVNASLQEKLKCLVFIPIISRTYCDPKSFAWEHEFKTFVELASKDQFGLKVKLPNGNVASRVLPIQIHDLKSEDKVLVEKKLGGFLRAVEFIYREPGVNRPLKSDDDDKINLNKTKYRNQINKTANAIDEIINSLASIQPPFLNEKSQAGKKLATVRKEGGKDTLEKSVKLSKRKVLSGVAILAVLIVTAILVYPKIFKRDTLEKLRSSGERISVVVMPFQNMTNDTAWNIWQDGIQNELVTSLTNAEELKVRQTESVNAVLKGWGLTNYASITPSVARDISQKLDANVFISGSIKQVDDIIRVNAQLIDSKTEDAYKSFQIDGTANNILHITDSLSSMVNNFFIISILKKEVSPVYIQNIGSPKSPDALKNFINGQNAFAKRDYPEAREKLINAIKIDSNFTMAIILLAFAYGNQGLYQDAKRLILNAYEKKDIMTKIDKASTEWAHAYFFGTPYEQLKYFKQLQDIDDQQAGIIYNIGSLYNSIYQYDKATIEFEKSLSIFKKWKIKPSWVFNYTDLGYAYHKTGQYEKEKRLYLKAEQDFPDDPDLIYRKVVLSLTEGDTLTANRHVEKLTLLNKENLIPEDQITTNLAEIYAEAGLLDKAEEYFRKALASEPDNPDRINTLGYFLIVKDRDINEGMVLVDKALELSPENFNYLHTKGCGLYKQERYKESLNILQKSWDLRREQAVYNHEAYLHLEAARKAVASPKNN